MLRWVEPDFVPEQGEQRAQCLTALLGTLRAPGPRQHGQGRSPPVCSLHHALQGVGKTSPESFSFHSSTELFALASCRAAVMGLALSNTAAGIYQR